MSLRERVFSRQRPLRQQSQAEQIADTILKVVLWLGLIGYLLFLGMHYL